MPNTTHKMNSNNALIDGRIMNLWNKEMYSKYKKLSAIQLEISQADLNELDLRNIDALNDPHVMKSIKLYASSCQSNIHTVCISRVDIGSATNPLNDDDVSTKCTGKIKGDKLHFYITHDQIESYDSLYIHIETAKGKFLNSSPDLPTKNLVGQQFPILTTNNNNINKDNCVTVSNGDNLVVIEISKDVFLQGPNLKMQINAQIPETNDDERDQFCEHLAKIIPTNKENSQQTHLDFFIGTLKDLEESCKAIQDLIPTEDRENYGIKPSEGRKLSNSHIYDTTIQPVIKLSVTPVLDLGNGELIYGIPSNTFEVDLPSNMPIIPPLSIIDLKLVGDNKLKVCENDIIKAQLTINHSVKPAHMKEAIYNFSYSKKGAENSVEFIRTKEEYFDDIDLRTLNLGPTDTVLLSYTSLYRDDNDVPLPDSECPEQVLEFKITQALNGSHISYAQGDAAMIPTVAHPHESHYNQTTNDVSCGLHSHIRTPKIPLNIPNHVEHTEKSQDALTVTSGSIFVEEPTVVRIESGKCIFELTNHGKYNEACKDEIKQNLQFKVNVLNKTTGDKKTSRNKKCTVKEIKGNKITIECIIDTSAEDCVYQATVKVSEKQGIAKPDSVDHFYRNTTTHELVSSETAHLANVTIASVSQEQTTCPEIISLSVNKPQWNSITLSLPNGHKRRINSLDFSNLLGVYRWKQHDTGIFSSGHTHKYTDDKGNEANRRHRHRPKFFWWSAVNAHRKNDKMEIWVGHNRVYSKKLSNTARNFKDIGSKGVINFKTVLASTISIRFTHGSNSQPKQATGVSGTIDVNVVCNITNQIAVTLKRPENVPSDFYTVNKADTFTEPVTLWVNKVVNISTIPNSQDSSHPSFIGNQSVSYDIKPLGTIDLVDMVQTVNTNAVTSIFGFDPQLPEGFDCDTFFTSKVKVSRSKRLRTLENGNWIGAKNGGQELDDDKITCNYNEEEQELVATFYGNSSFPITQIYAELTSNVDEPIELQTGSTSVKALPILADNNITVEATPVNVSGNEYSPDKLDIKVETPNFEHVSDKIDSDLTVKVSNLSKAVILEDIPAIITMGQDYTNQSTETGIDGLVEAEFTIEVNNDLDNCFFDNTYVKTINTVLPTNVKDLNRDFKAAHFNADAPLFTNTDTFSYTKSDGCDSVTTNGSDGNNGNKLVDTIASTDFVVTQNYTFNDAPYTCTRHAGNSYIPADQFLLMNPNQWKPQTVTEKINRIKVCQEVLNVDTQNKTFTEDTITLNQNVQFVSSRFTTPKQQMSNYNPGNDEDNTLCKEVIIDDSIVEQLHISRMVIRLNADVKQSVKGNTITIPGLSVTYQPGMGVKDNKIELVNFSPIIESIKFTQVNNKYCEFKIKDLHKVFSKNGTYKDINLVYIDMNIDSGTSGSDADIKCLKGKTKKDIEGITFKANVSCDKDGDNLMLDFSLVLTVNGGGFSFYRITKAVPNKAGEVWESIKDHLLKQSQTTHTVKDISNNINNDDDYLIIKGGNVKSTIPPSFNLSVNEGATQNIPIKSYPHKVLLSELGIEREATTITLEAFVHNKCLYAKHDVKFFGCMDETAANYDATANTDDGSCIATGWYIPHYVAVAGQNDPKGLPAHLIDGPDSIPADLTFFSTNELAGNQEAATWVMGRDPYCEFTIYDTLCQAQYDAYEAYTGSGDPAGCMVENAFNYDPEATWNYGCIPVINGCMDPAADNYITPINDPAVDVNTEDGSCQFLGCTDITASNYDANANTDDGSCVNSFSVKVKLKDSYGDSWDPGNYDWDTDRVDLTIAEINGSPINYHIDITSKSDHILETDTNPPHNNSYALQGGLQAWLGNGVMTFDVPGSAASIGFVLTDHNTTGTPWLSEISFEVLRGEMSVGEWGWDDRDGSGKITVELQ